MSENSKAIINLCSHFINDEEIQPLENSEWSKLAQKMIENNIEPYELMKLNTEIISKLELDNDYVNRIKKLVARSANITFQLNKYEKMGIKIITRADKDYPSKIKKQLKNLSPPIIYYCGDLNLLNKELVGFVGSRKIDASDKIIVEKLVKKATSKGYGIVSGGAKGIDEISSKIALENDGYVVEFLSDSMIKKIKDINIKKHVRNKKLLLCSVSSPEVGFNVGLAMMRNKYIYLSSNGTIVIKSDYKKGGTWSGAVENLKKNYSQIYCIENENIGNKELIKIGAIPINDDWNFELKEKLIKKENNQLSLF